LRKPERARLRGYLGDVQSVPASDETDAAKTTIFQQPGEACLNSSREGQGDAPVPAEYLASRVDTGTAVNHSLNDLWATVREPS